MVEESQKKKQKKKNPIPFRLNILFLMVFLAFSVLIIRLGIVQIVNGQTYNQKMKLTQHFTTNIQSARGLIFDRNGVLLAGNQASSSVMFTRNQDMTSNDLINLAKKLSAYLPVSTKTNVPKGMLTTSSVTQRDLKDYWIGTHPKAYQDKLTKEQASSPQAYQLLLTKITQTDLKSISPQELKVVTIWRELAQTSNLSPTTIAAHLNTQELARLGEHLSDFNGAIDTSVAATRTYPKGNLFFLGSVGQIPKHEINNYLAAGNNRNDLVGVSNLEQQYNDVLSGIPKTLTFTTDNGKPVGSPTVQEGRRGDDLVLTINYKFQQQVIKLIQDQIKQCYPSDHLCNQAYAVVMNPNTGGIIALAGQKYDGKTFQDVSDGTVLNSFAIGSAVKGGTVLAGYQNNAIPGILTDKPINFSGGNVFSSDVTTIGTVNTAQALEFSSNVYMGTVAGRMAGFNIVDQGSNYLAHVTSGPKFVHAFETLRDVYGQLGLGVHTGIDLPFESTGYQGPIPYSEPGKIMQFAIGQYDTYTPLQMAQYVSTIANGGYRIEPHLLESIHFPAGLPNQVGPSEKTVSPKVLNKLPNTASQIQTVHQGFYLVTHGGPGATASMIGALWPKYDIAAKTGTAQVPPINSGRNNKTLVAFAPYKNPQVAVSIVVPDILNEHTNLYLGGKIIKAYFDSKAGQ